MNPKELLEQIGKLGVIPVVGIEKATDALPLADALLEGGLPIVEITFRTTAAAQAIQILVRERPSLLVGAGTVLTSDNLRTAREAGARFGVAPGLNAEVVQQAQSAGLPFVPGVVTPSEVERALSLGCTTLKFFPAEAIGGVEMIKALAAPYGPRGVKFIPTGGVNTTNLESYLAYKAVTAVGGTWIANWEDLAAGNWQDIRQRCALAVETVRRVRGLPQ